jgi:hypothetical protein
MGNDRPLKKWKSMFKTPKCRLVPLLLLLTLPVVAQAQFNYPTNADGLSVTITGYTGNGGAVASRGGNNFFRLTH